MVSDIFALPRLCYTNLMKKIVVASKNPVKLNATQDGFARMFPNNEYTVEGISINSGVNDQPIGNDETYMGASNRLTAAIQAVPDADYWVAIEGGIDINNDDMESAAWIIIQSQDGQFGRAKTSSFMLPPEIIRYIHEGQELGTATDIVFGKTNSKQAGGSIAELTDSIITRTTYYEEAVICALIPFKNPALYPN